MSNTYPPPPPPGGQDPDRSFDQPGGQQGGQTPPPPPPPAYGGPQQGGQMPPPPPAYGQDQGGYGAMPGAPMPSGPAAVATRPPAMENAVKLMRLGGLVSLLSLLTLFFSTGATREAIEKQLRDNDASVSQDTIDTAVSFSIGLGVVFALFGVALWFWMASANGKGRSWARIVATVFFAIQVLSFLYSFTQSQPVITRLFGVIMLAIGAGAIYFMYRPESSQFYQARSRPQY